MLFVAQFCFPVESTAGCVGVVWVQFAVLGSGTDHHKHVSGLSPPILLHIPRKYRDLKLCVDKLK